MVQTCCNSSGLVIIFSYKISSVLLPGHILCLMRGKHSTLVILTLVLIFTLAAPSRFRYSMLEFEDNSFYVPIIICCWVIVFFIHIATVLGLHSGRRSQISFGDYLAMAT